MVRVADYIINFVAEKGVKEIFTVCGGGSIFMNDALGIHPDLEYVACHHEQAAAMAGEAYSRVSENMGVTLVTTGPGGTNALTGVAGSFVDSVPHLILSGQVFLNQTIADSGLRQLGSQELNIVSVVKPITKYAVLVEDPKDIKYHLQKAWHIAKSGRPGPVWLDIPANIQMQSVDEDDLIGFDPEEYPVEVDDDWKEKVSEIVDRLKTAERPLLHAGHGVRISRSIDDFMHLAERNGIPFVTARNANDIVATDHPLFVGRPGTFCDRAGNFAVQNADVYVSIGTRLSLPQTGYNSKDYARNAFRVMVDIDRAELDKKTLDFHVLVQADAKAFLIELNRQLEDLALDCSSWVKQCQTWKSTYPVVQPEHEAHEGSVNTYHFTSLLSDALDADDVIVTDMGTAFQLTHQAFRVKRGQRMFTNCGVSSMGWGLPGAIGACFAHGKKRTVCLTGDGGLQMNIQELATVMHHQLPIKIFIYSNGGYVTMKQTYEVGFDDRYMGCGDESLSFPDYSKIAEAHGIKFLRSLNHSDVEATMNEALSFEGPVICEVMTDPAQPQAPRFLPRKGPDGKNIPTAFEDLHPHLPVEEVKRNMIGGNK